MTDKPSLRAALVASIGAALDTARAAHQAAIEGATHSEARAENDKDTRGLEQSYLARGQAQRVVELEAGLAAAQKLSIEARSRVSLGALVTVDEDGATSRIYVAPAGGGAIIAGDVQVLTPQSPLGKALLGKLVGDEAEVRLPGKVRTLTIVEIA
ncbi:MAG: GreA/GreB family elongation factor [Proteobacteria bacterium]|nr:GreA/GreB family elongation factor [Pseudomonadota bacterium]